MTARAVAILPARGGSKRVPRKNIRPFHGKPMIAWPIAAAKASGLFERIVVSTEDAEVADVARTCGAEAPFLRPAELADDHTATMPVIQHAISALGCNFAFACLIYPTAATLSPDDLREGFERLSARADKAYALSVTDFAAPVQRALRIGSDGALDALYPEFRQTRSQDLEPAYHDAAQFCWGRVDAWRAETPVFSSATLPVVLPRWRVQDVDTPEDWRRAELMFAALQAQDDPSVSPE